MVRKRDTTPRPTRGIPPNSDIPPDRRPPTSAPMPSEALRQIVVGLATNNPGWDARRIQAEVRAAHPSHNATLELISSIVDRHRSRGR
jgi:hypothetical protein